jgi:hypothetical protein
MCVELNKKVDHGVIQQICSLFNSGVLELRTTGIRGNQFDDKENMKFQVSQCVDIQFKGKERIVELEEEVRKLKFMVDNGLGWEDMKNDTKYPNG